MRAKANFLLGTRILPHDGGFFGQHHRNLVANRIDAPAGDAFQPGLIGQEFYRCLTHRTNKNVESVFGNSQNSSLARLTTRQ